MSNHELFRPQWRDAKALAAVLPTDQVSAEIQKAMLNRVQGEGAVQEKQQELNGRFHCLLRDLRLQDLGSCWYWGVMLAFGFAYLIIELIVVIIAASTPTLALFQNLIVVCLTGLTVLLLLYIVVMIRLVTAGSLPPFLQRVPPSFFHATPVIWVSGFSLFLNFYIVFETGFSQSPYLTAFLASALIILSLPRENSFPVVVLGVAALVFGGVGAWTVAPPSEEILIAWGGAELARQITLLTFLYSGVSVVILRSIANHTVVKR